MPTRRFVVALLLASFGLISACGSGLHGLVDGSTLGLAPGSAEPGSLAWDDGHADCSICQALGQGFLATTPPPAVALGAVQDATTVAEAGLDPSPPRRWVAPRAPPAARA